MKLFQTPLFLLFFYFVKGSSFDYITSSKPFQYNYRTHHSSNSIIPIPKKKTALFLQKKPFPMPPPNNPPSQLNTPIYTSNIEFNTTNPPWYIAPLKLIRVNNLVPTLLLSFTGGWIIDPSIQYLAQSTSFWASTIDTVFVMFASMAINDIYDIQIDKINNPSRPLITGELQTKDAVLIVLLLLGATEYITFQYLPTNLQMIIQAIILQIILYTPVLKKIPIIKNISCAVLVSFSIFFAGLSTSYSIDKAIATNMHFGLLSIAMSFIFFGSWGNEVLLDIRDAEGDKQHNIKTLATLFGKPFSWNFANALFYLNIFFNGLSLAYLYNDLNVSILTTIIFFPLLHKLNLIQKNNYSEESIVQYMNYSNYPLFALLIYFCFLSYSR